MGNMEYIKATFGILDQCAVDIFKAGSNIKSIGEDFPKPADPEWFTPYENIKAALNRLQTSTTTMGNYFELFAGKLASSNDNYKKAEALIEGGLTLENDAEDGSGSNDEDKIHEMDQYQLLFGDDVNFGIDIDGNIIKHDGSYIGDKKYKIQDIETGEMIEVDEEDYNKIMGDSSFLEHVKIYGDDVGATWALGRWGNDSGTFQATIGEVHAYAGWEVTADGTLTGSMGVGGSLFEMGGEGKVGSDSFNVHGAYDVKVCAAEANASGHIGLGGFGGEAKAEAVLMSVSGEAGVDILGADLKVQGSVGIGLGASARAEVDWSTGHVQLGVSAYFGVGGDISLDLDLSGVKDVWDKGVEVFDDVADGAAKVWDAITFWD